MRFTLGSSAPKSSSAIGKLTFPSDEIKFSSDDVHSISEPNLPFTGSVRSESVFSGIVRYSESISAAGLGYFIRRAGFTLSSDFMPSKEYPTPLVAASLNHTTLLPGLLSRFLIITFFRSPVS